VRRCKPYRNALRLLIMSAKPNFLFISADGMRYDSLGCNGNALAKTPNIDRLASQGTRFSRSYCSQPICMPCRSSIMTGRYPSAHGVWQNGIALDPSQPLLPELLSHGGYHTACYGKCHFKPWLPSLTPDERAHRPEYVGDGPYYGFDRVRVADHSPQDQYYDWLKENFPQHLGKAKHPFDERPEGATVAWKGTLPAEATKTRYISELTTNAIGEQRAEQPFFIWSSIIDPHHPYNPPAPFCDWYDGADFAPPPSKEGPGNLPKHYHAWLKRLHDEWGHVDTAQKHWLQVRRMYQGKVSHVDHEVGRILAALDEAGLADNTIVLFWSDHGTMLGDFGLLQIGEYSQESLIRVPMIWRGPGVDQQTSNALTSAVDVMPTLLSMAGIDVPTSVQGSSLTPLLDYSQPTVRDQLIVENRWGQNPPEGFNTLVTDQYKLSLYTNGNEGELYDLQKDPQELNNLFDQPDMTQVQADLSQRMAVELLRQRDPLPMRTACW